MKPFSILTAAVCAASLANAGAALVSEINPLMRPLAQETPDAGRFISQAALQAIITAADDTMHAGVFDCETEASGNITGAEPDWAVPGISITGAVRYGRNDASASGLLAFTSGERFGFVKDVETWNLTPLNGDEVVTHFGVVFSQWRVGADLLSVTAYFTDGSSETYTSTVDGPAAGVSEATYEFVGFKAPPGFGIGSVEITEATGGDWVGFDDISFVVGPPLSADPYAEWATGYGLSGEASAQGADPDHDSVVNLLEYVLGTEPDSAAVDPRPEISVEGGNFVVFFSRSNAAAANGYQLTVEYTTDPASAVWTTATAGMTGVIEDDPAGLVTVTIPLPPGESRLFARLRATGPNP